MTDYRPKHDGTDHPAEQPHPPNGGCDKLPETTPPTLDPPAKCPDPPECCHCPTPPSSTPNCLEALIEQQTAQMTVADKAKAFKTELEALLTKARAASQEYTADRYSKLLKQWQEQDRQIAELIRKLVCAVPCWRCVIECYVCPLLNELHYSEVWLYGDGTFASDAHNLYDLRYWLERDMDAKQRRFLRIKGVLAAWETPAKTIEKALQDNAKLISDAEKALGTDSAKVVYDVFLKLVPMHLAIAPPAKDPDTTTKIDHKYTDFCGCDTGTPDDCCGPDVGEFSLRDRILGPQPYLIDPNNYFKVICCLVEQRYLPAKDAAAAAEAAFQAKDNEIKRRHAQISEALKPGAFEKSAKAAIPATIDCGDCDCDDDPKTTQAR
jgi:hypothetical protein